LTQEFTETAKVFEQRTNQVEEHIVKAQRELRQHILDQSRTLRDEFWVRYRELSEVTDHGIQELRAEKTDRATLAVLLTELAICAWAMTICCRGTSDLAPEMRHGQTTRRLSSASQYAVAMVKYCHAGGPWVP
jgi:hypothetical protein